MENFIFFTVFLYIFQSSVLHDSHMINPFLTNVAIL